MEDVKSFLNISSGSGSGRGSGYGYGNGNGYGDGYGNGRGNGYGNGYGDGYGNGRGNGYGNGYGSGNGYGDGYGNGRGNGYGNGYGSGKGYDYGDRLKNFCGEDVYYIDGVPTILRRVRGNIARGEIVKDDMTLTPCWIVKGGDKFAHGENIHKAMEALRDKLFEDMPEGERIAAFVAEHEWGVEYPDRDFYDWHHRLTGSCEMGRNEFARSHGLEKLDGKRTVESFIALTRNSYGGDVIRKLEKAYQKS